MRAKHRVGIDLVEVERIRGLASRHPGFLDRVFTPRERDYCDRHADPACHYAARFAAKEAAFKALRGEGRALRFLDYEVEMEGGRPRLLLHGKAREEARLLGVSDLDLSLSHERGCAVAVVLVEWEGAG
jgi:holo-[acyl-carrier protein] synthase